MTCPYFGLNLRKKLQNRLVLIKRNFDTSTVLIFCDPIYKPTIQKNCAKKIERFLKLYKIQYEIVIYKEATAYCISQEDAEMLNMLLILQGI